MGEKKRVNQELTFCFLFRLTDVGSGDVSARVKVDADELALENEKWLVLVMIFIGFVSTHESGGVVVLDGLGVAESLQDGVGLQELLLELTLNS